MPWEQHPEVLAAEANQLVLGGPTAYSQIHPSPDECAKR